MQKIRHLFTTMFSKITLTTPVAIVIGALLIAVSHITYALILSGQTASAPTEFFKGRSIDKSDLVTGNTKSDVVIVEYSDTECPFCAQLHPTMQKLKEEYASKVAFVYRYFPLVQIHPNAFDEAKAVYCVGKLAGAEKRQNYINELFTYKISKKNMTLPQGGKEALAKNIGIDGTALTSCLQSQESSDAVNEGLKDGIAAGVEGTPATFVLVRDGDQYEVVSLVAGARPYEYFKAVVEEALKK